MWNLRIKYYKYKKILLPLPCLDHGCTYHFDMGKYCIHVSFNAYKMYFNFEQARRVF